MNVYRSAQELVGKTPLLELTALEAEYGLEGSWRASIPQALPRTGWPWA